MTRVRINRASPASVLLYRYAVRFYGKAAIVTGLEDTTGAGVAAQARFTHVWARSKRKWLLVAVQRTEVMPSP